MKDNVKIFLGIIIFCIASVAGKMTYEGLKGPKTYNHRYSTENLNTKYTNYSMSTSGDTVNFKMHDKTTNNESSYNVNIKDSAKKFNPVIEEQQKKYLTQNKELVSQASKAYGFIIANDYKLVKYCSQYYPVNKLKQKFDNRFKDKKLKAENILNKAFGQDGAKNFKTSIVSNQSVQQTFQKQIEDDYVLTRKMAVADGNNNFTRKEYCKMLDESADFAVETDYKKFKLMVPNF